MATTTTPDRIVAGGSGSASGALAADELRPIEARAEVDSLGDLQQRRRELLNILAPLKALYGPFGLFDDRRKRMLEAMKVKVRAELTSGDGKKPTEAQIDAMAYADPQYERYLDDAYEAKIEYVRLANEEVEIAERIRSREIELLAYNSEVKLDR